MRLFSENRRIYVGTLIAAGSLVAALGYHVICGEHGYLALRREKQQFDALRKQSVQLQLENDSIQKQITALKTDPKTIEKRAREDSLMARPGEIIIRYSDATTKPPAAANAAPASSTSSAPAEPPK